MKDSALNWHNLGWGNFENLTMHLLAEKFPELSLARYLKQGNAQHGVDITGFNDNTGKHVCIQCKDTSIDVTALGAISKAFIKGDFFLKSETFILATTADLQNKKAQDYIRTQEEYFHKNGISYECWDINKLNDLLKHQFRIVHHYFSLAQATEHCLPAAPLASTIKPIKNFIPRHISDLKEKSQARDIWSIDYNKKTYSLTEVITTSPMETKAICLLADPYEGKTLLLEQTISELRQHAQPYSPLLLTVKTLPILPIAELLTSKFRTWETMPARDTIIFIDGLDEVPTNRFFDTLNNINLFRTKYPYINIVITCRTLFFHHYRVDSNLSDFQYFSLEDLSFYHQHQYLSQNLKTRKEKFLKKMESGGLMDFLGKPFYLINLVNWYKNDPRSIPLSKIEIINKFIEESLNSGHSRRLSGSEILDHQRVKHRNTIQNLALALQLSGLNAAPKDFMQQLFDSTEIELLQNSPIISHSGEYWSFYNAMFQEQLAAMRLKDYPFEKIAGLVTIGSEVKKIRTKWIQTVASYLSVTAENNPDRKAMIELINKDNPEIFTICDSTKFNVTFRLDVIKAIITRSITKQIRLLLVRESVIALFVDGEKTILSYLLDIISSQAPERVKIICCRILRECPIDTSLLPQVENNVQKELLKAGEPYYAQLLFELLAKNKLSGSAFIDNFISNSPLINEQECRDGVYMLLVSLGLVDEYFQFGLTGFQILIDYNEIMNHHASERELEQFFLGTRSSTNLIRLYDLLCSKPWLSFYRNKAAASREFIQQLAELSIVLYQQDKQILSAVVNFFIAGEKRHFNKEISALNTFFKLTATSGLALELYLLRSDGKHYHYDFSTLVDEMDLDRIIRLAHDGHITANDVDSTVAALFRDSRPQQAEALRKMSLLVLPKPQENKNSYHQVYLEAEATRKRNDYVFLQSKDSFRTALENFFTHFKSGAITTGNLFKDPERRIKRTHLESTHLISFISNCQNADKKITLSNCTEVLDKPGYFEYWRADKILRNNLSENLQDLQLQSILETFYYSELKNVDFAVAYRHSSIPNFQSKERLLVNIWKKMAFNTPDEIVLDFTWMMDEGIKGMASAEINKKKSLAGCILKHFEGREELLEEQILKNFESGIDLESTIASHLELCEKLSISETPDIILGLIEKKSINYNTIYHALQIYKVLNGELELLLPYFHRLSLFENYNFERLTQYLIAEFPEQICPRLNKALTTELVNDEDKMTAAKYLAQSGRQEGFSYIIDCMKSSQSVPYEIQSNYKIWKVETAWALSTLNQVFYLLLDTSFHSSKFYLSPDRFILEILKGLAGKSEQDLLLVLNFMETQCKENQEKYPETANNLIWYAEIMLEDFRNEEDGQLLELPQIKDFITTA